MSHSMSNGAKLNGAVDQSYVYFFPPQSFHLFMLLAFRLPFVIVGAM